MKKIDKSNFINIKNYSVNNIKNSQATEWEKILANTYLIKFLCLQYTKTSKTQQ